MNINENVIFQIANSTSRIESIALVSCHLKHTYTTLSDNLRNEILIDSVLDLIYFTLKKGFTLGECVACCSIFYKLIIKFNQNPNSITLTESLDLFSSMLIQLSSVMNKIKLRQFIDYMNLTFFTHFNLFKFVFLNERENQMQNEKRFVNCPHLEGEESSSTAPLSEAKSYQQWEYDRKQAKLDNAGKIIKDKFQTERIALGEKEKNLKNDLRDCDEQEDELTEKLIENMINEISMPRVDLAYLMSKTDVNEFSEMKIIHTQKNAIEKPESIVFNPPPKKGTKDLSKLLKLKK